MGQITQNKPCFLSFMGFSAGFAPIPIWGLKPETKFCPNIPPK
jgi:hypothetical protein